MNDKLRPSERIDLYYVTWVNAFCVLRHMHAGHNTFVFKLK